MRTEPQSVHLADRGALLDGLGAGVSAHHRADRGVHGPEAAARPMDGGEERGHSGAGPDRILHRKLRKLVQHCQTVAVAGRAKPRPVILEHGY